MFAEGLTECQKSQKKKKKNQTRLSDLNAKQQLYAGVEFISVKKLLEISQVICVKELVVQQSVLFTLKMTVLALF